MLYDFIVSRFIGQERHNKTNPLAAESVLIYFSCFYSVLGQISFCTKYNTLELGNT